MDSMACRYGVQIRNSGRMSGNGKQPGGYQRFLASRHTKRQIASSTPSHGTGPRSSLLSTGETRRSPAHRSSNGSNSTPTNNSSINNSSAVRENHQKMSFSAQSALVRESTPTKTQPESRTAPHATVHLELELNGSDYEEEGEVKDKKEEGKSS